MPKLTIQDVARRAGVGVGTVSRVLNNHAAVSGPTREMVLRTIRELNFTPNPHARRVAGGRSYSVSVMLPVVSTEFYLRLMDGLEQALGAARYDVAIFPLLDRARLERYLSSHTLAYQADGLVMASYNLAGFFPQGRLSGDQPCVLVDGYSPQLDCAYLDNVLGGQLAGEYAATLPGELRAVWIENDLDRVFPTSVFDDRRSGFLQALRRSGRRLAAELACSFDPFAARAVAAQLLDEARLPTTVFASADLLALALLDEAAARGLALGRELRVIGFDDQPWAEARGLTSLRQPVEAMGQAGAELLLSRLAGFTGAPRARRFEPVLVKRASTGD